MTPRKGDPGAPVLETGIQRRAARPASPDPSRSAPLHPALSDVLSAMTQAQLNLLEVLIDGLARLIDGQRRMADELGINYSHAFHYDFSMFAGQDIRAVLRSRLVSEPPAEVAKHVQVMFEDLSQHHVALMSAMDIVARRAIKYLAPALTSGGDGVAAQLAPVWRRYRRRHQRIETDASLRYNVLIAPAMVHGYVAARKKFRQTG